MDILIRKATTADLDLVTHIESTCFPPAEAASREAFKERLDYYAGQFLIAFDGDTLSVLSMVLYLMMKF